MWPARTSGETREEQVLSASTRYERKKFYRYPALNWRSKAGRRPHAVVYTTLKKRSCTTRLKDGYSDGYSASLRAAGAPPIDVLPANAEITSRRNILDARRPFRQTPIQKNKDAPINYGT